MLLSDFPLEMLINVADYLSLKDRISCSLVCKSWTKVFQDSMHSDLVINFTDDLYDAIDLLKGHERNYEETRHLVRKLYIQRSTQATDDELSALQKFFRNIIYFYLETSCLTSINLESKTGWHYWRSLRQLYISVYNPPQSFTDKYVIEILSRLPLLERLDIVGMYGYRVKIAFSFDDFETMHSCLPYLTHLGLSLNQIDIYDADLERMTKVSPAPKIVSFKINSIKTDDRWLYYFARKYPKLRTFEFESYNSTREDEEEHSINTKSFLQTSYQPFQHLSKLDITYANCLGTECLFFWDMVRPYNIPLKHVSIKVFLLHDGPYLNRSYCLSQNITKTCLKAASRTIESFHIQSNEDHLLPFSAIDNEDRLYNLVKLNINNSISSIELDMLLQAAPRLKDLLLQYTDVKIKDEIYNSKRFRLQTFSIMDSTITSDVLRFLSYQCRNLDELYLIDTKVSGNFSVPGCQFIDMTYTRLEKLILKRAVFIINDNKESTDNSNITLLTRPVDDIPPKQDYDPSILPAAIEATPTKDHYLWFCTGTNSTMEYLPKTRAQHARRFFSNYEKNKQKAIERVACAEQGTPYIQWNNRCVFGYTKIELGYVDYYDMASS